jgi:hypothetical protein
MLNWYQRNKDYKKQRNKEYYEKNKAACKDRYKTWYRKNKELRSKYDSNRRNNLRITVLTYYSKGIPKCNLCFFDDVRALVIDHINDDGAYHRKQLQGQMIYIDIINKGYPKGFQVLCANCNTIKEYNRVKGWRGGSGTGIGS